MIEAPATAETPEDDPFKDMRKAEPWLNAIAEAEKAFAEYHDKCDNIDKLYANLKRMASVASERQMQMFWANLEVLKPSIYARPPIPVVTPKFKSRKELPRVAADILERALLSSFDLEDIHEAFKGVRDDLALSSRGQMWLRHDIDGETGVEAVRYEHVERRDFLHEAARKWSEVKWVAKRSWLDAEAGRARFGDEWASVKMEARKGPAVEGSTGDKVGEVWEIWHKAKKAVVWVSPNQDKAGQVLDIQKPMFNLQRFFPCPKPAYGTVEPHTLRPVPDFVYYKDQLEEINELTARISALSEALKMKGFYAAGSGEIGDAIEAAIKATDNNAIMIPVPNMAAMGATSLKDSVIWLPVVEVANTIRELIALRQQLITDVYQITGISDIMRGNTDANETLGAQQLKSQYGNVRIRDRQEAIIQMSLDVTEIAAEIMAENFSPETLKTLSQVDDVPSQADIEQQIEEVNAQVMQAMQDPQAMQMAQENPEQAQQLLDQAEQQIQTLQNTVTFEKAIELLRAQHLRPFILDIETNSTIQPDEQADKEARLEALTAIGGFIQQAGQMVAAKPETGPFVAEMLKYVASGFRMGRGIETAIDEFAEQIAKQAEQQPGPDPAQMQMEAQMQAESQKLEAEMGMKQAEMQMKAEMHQADIGIKQQELEIKGVELQIKQADLGVKARKNELDAVSNAMTAAQPAVQ
jgi:hypothetical protein